MPIAGEGPSLGPTSNRNAPKMVAGAKAAAPGPEQAGKMPGGGPEGGADPVVGAFKTLQTLGMALKEKGDPKGEAVMKWLQQGISIFTGGKEGPKPEAGPAAPPGPGGPPSAQGARPQPALI